MGRTPFTSPQTLLVFEALLQDPAGWTYGYPLAKATSLKSGTLYPILMRLTEHGLLEAQWRDPDKPGRPPRHEYRLTAKGQDVGRQRLAQAQAITRPGKLIPRLNSLAVQPSISGVAR
jgi:DNA-binding PadR family transcriptional regulator